MSALKYWLWLTSTRHLGPQKICALLDAFGSPENVFYATDADLSAVEGLTGAALNELYDKSLDRAERILERCELTNVRVLTMQDAEFPDRLKNIYAPPSVLYVRGKLPPMDEEAALTIVGSRSASPYGLHVAQRMSYQLAKSGMLIVSGLAKGADAMASVGALQAGKPTVAVLGCGADIVYPAENRELFEDVAYHGAIVTEYPPGTPVVAANFPARNRIMSGLSLGTLVVEAPRHSGALITAQYALEQGRDVFAIPGNIDARESEGCLELIKVGAMLVSEPDDILREYAPLFPSKLSLPGVRQSPAVRPTVRSAGPSREVSAEAPPKAIDLSAVLTDHSPEQQRLMLTIAGTARHIDEIIELTDLSAAQALSELTVLELEGLVTQLPGKLFVLSVE